VALEHRDWNELTRSIHQNRASNALFYKPVCVIAAIDLADAGGLVSDMLYAELIIRKFEQYVRIAFPSRASKGWWPLWFLANDGLWAFSRKGKLLSKADLASRPTTKNKTLERFDLQAITSEYRALWDDPAHRKTLRDQMLAIMNRYPESKVLVRALFNPALIDQPEKWPSEEAVDRYLNDLTGQGDLFDSSADGAQASRRSAADVRKALSTFDVGGLPTITPVGPNLEITGETPIAISAGTHREITSAQKELYDDLLQKCLQLASVSDSSNRAAHLGPALGKLIQAVEGPVEASSGYLIWSPGNTLRRLLVADIRARKVDDPDVPPLTDIAGELLNDLVEHFNVYAMTDHLVGLLDHAKSGPAGRANLTDVLDAGSDIVSALRQAPQIVTPETARVLEDVTQNAQSAKNAAGIDAEQAVANAVEIQRNTAGGILRNAALEIKNFAQKLKSPGKTLGEGALKQIGAEVVKWLPITLLVNGARDAFVALWQGTTSSEVVNYFVGLIRDFFMHFRP
jgi:hypothetical protein